MFNSFFQKKKEAHSDYAEDFLFVLALFLSFGLLIFPLINFPVQWQLSGEMLKQMKTFLCTEILSSRFSTKMSIYIVW